MSVAGSKRRAVALGGDCPADVGMLWAKPTSFGPMASYPTDSRLIDALASVGPKAFGPALRRWIAGGMAPYEGVGGVRDV
ncbi:hypothetical protein D7Y56_00655 (plasmid) [Streptomyces sp. S501]|nr:hypothetical protein D7Y56_00655 [Streptomyces sp. S501]